MLSRAAVRAAPKTTAAPPTCASCLVMIVLQNTPLLCKAGGECNPSAAISRNQPSLSSSGPHLFSVNAGPERAFLTAFLLIDARFCRVRPSGEVPRCTLSEVGKALCLLGRLGEEVEMGERCNN
ncbi:hypothetical protein L209DRAFT_365392 [Thermothelomyces heterothallicus CBS 203.75]